MDRTQAGAASSAAPNLPSKLAALYRIEPWIAGISLAALLPVLLVAAGIILVLARRSPVVRHRRVGWLGCELPMLKLRTMWEPKQPWGPLFAIEEVSNQIPADKCTGDDRVTSRFAAWCRRYSIDELPQLYHVLRGEMSLAGPRPITRAEWDEHYGPSAAAVLALRPGLTGLWQTAGRSRLTYAQRRHLDLWLARRASPALYFLILARSVRVVWQGRDAY